MHPTLDVLVSSVGEVFVPANGKNKAHWTFGHNSGRGYLRVRINGRLYLVHRLVADTFLGDILNPDNKPEVDHISRDKKANFVENLRWASRSDNMRNTSEHDRVDARGGTHKYEDEKQFCRERMARYSNTHKNICFSDGKRRWLPTSEALELLKLPVKDRTYRSG
jgi:hypothetical protein